MQSTSSGTVRGILGPEEGPAAAPLLLILFIMLTVLLIGVSYWNSLKKTSSVVHTFRTVTVAGTLSATSIVNLLYLHSRGMY